MHQQQGGSTTPCGCCACSTSIQPHHLHNRDTKPTSYHGKPITRFGQQWYNNGHNSDHGKPITRFGQQHCNNGNTKPNWYTPTSSNTPSSALVQGGFNSGFPPQGWMANQFGPGYQWTPGPGHAPYPPNLNYWYPYHPGPLPSQQGTSPQPPPQVQQGTESPTRENRSRRQRLTTPPPNNDTSTKEMFVSAFRTMFAKEIGAASSSSGTMSMGKSAKILNGVNQYSLCVYAGCKITEDISEIF